MIPLRHSSRKRRKRNLKGCSPLFGRYTLLKRHISFSICNIKNEIVSEAKAFASAKHPRLCSVPPRVDAFSVLLSLAVLAHVLRPATKSAARNMQIARSSRDRSRGGEKKKLRQLRKKRHPSTQTSRPGPSCRSLDHLMKIPTLTKF